MTDPSRSLSERSESKGTRIRRGVRRPCREAHRDRGGDEPQDTRAHGRRDDVGRGEGLAQRIRVPVRVERGHTGDAVVDGALAHLVHGVPAGRGDRVDEGGLHVGEGHVVAGLVQQEADEAAADVAGAEVDGGGAGALRLAALAQGPGPSRWSSSPRSGRIETDFSRSIIAGR